MADAATILAISIRYAKERKAFGKSISEFGMIQHKLAEMAIRMFASESMTYRVVGNIEAQLEGFSWDAPDAGNTMLKAVEEFATECSFIKVFASETLDYVVDEGVQIHGGYGFHQDYAVEHAYRDSRINRIFEGTNEINRLLATGMMLKRAQKGTLPLVQAVMKLQSGDSRRAIAWAAKSTWWPMRRRWVCSCSASRIRNIMAAIEEQQEVVANITDILMNAYAIESATLRAQKIARSGRNAENADGNGRGVRARGDGYDRLSRPDGARGLF